MSRQAEDDMACLQMFKEFLEGIGFEIIKLQKMGKLKLQIKKPEN
ncbi:hypothetical protein ACFL35_09395 [Candidatus Riflebacteria bacterium]